MPVELYVHVCYTIIAGKGNRPEYAGQEASRMEDNMTNDQFNSLLETLAKLIESKALTVEEAATIVRDAKTK